MSKGLQKRPFSILLLFFALQCCILKTQAQLITVNSTIPQSLDACGDNGLFSITINNPSAFNLSAITVTVTMPAGITYHTGSVSNAFESNISNLTAPTFSLNPIASQTATTFTFFAYANCNVQPSQLTQNTMAVKYTSSNSLTFTNTFTSATYTIKQANLTIPAFSNQSFAGTVGGSFTRCATVTNGGLGSLKQFVFTDIHGSGITITSVNKGTWTSNANTETVTLNGVDFTSIGDGDTLFESGESIVICENVSITNCAGVQSNIQASWGCDNQTCQSASTTANITFPGLTPNLVFTPTRSQSACLGVGNYNTQSVVIRNAVGAGNAVNVNLNIYQSTGSGFHIGLLSQIVANSITIKTNNGAPVPATIINPLYSSTANAGACLNTTTPLGGFTIQIPVINGGDSVIIKWDVETCCTRGTMNGWMFSGNYEDICQNNFNITPTWGRVYSSLTGFLTNNNSPSSLVSGNTGTFNFMVNSYQFTYPTSTGGHWKVVFTLPACVTFSNTIGAVSILSATSSATWMPTSVTQTGNQVTAIFSPGTPPFSLQQAQILINLTANCTSCSGGVGNVNASLLYVPTTSACTCEIPISNTNASVNIICPVSCLGLNFKNFDVGRVNFGKPDNNDDGLPDALGNLNPNTIRKDRAMYGDTIKTTFYATIATNSVFASWKNLVVHSVISPGGNNLAPLGGTILIYRGGNLFATCNSIKLHATSGAATFRYSLHADTLVKYGCVSPGFTYQNNDSVVFSASYRVKNNIGAQIVTCNVTNSFFVSTSNLINPGAATRYTCNSFQGNFSILGYAFSNWGPGSISLNGCGNIAVSQNYYFFIGNSNGNLVNWSNFFPFEYRKFITLDTAFAIIPTGFSLVGASIYERRTSGTLVFTQSPTYPITPINANTTNLAFPINSFFQGTNPQIYPSDEGFVGTITLTLTSSCNASSAVQPIDYRWKFNKNTILDTTYNKLVSSGINQDFVTYSSPDFFIQSSLPTITAPDSTGCWDIFITNVTNVNAPNTWIAKQPGSGITITAITDMSNGTTVPLSGNGFYQLGVLNGATTKNYKICATYTSCNPDSITIEAGWNCGSYPTSLNTLACPSKKIKLKLIPETPLFQLSVTQPPSNISLCDTAEYSVHTTNVDIGTAYNIFLSTALPPGVSIINNSSTIKFTGSSSTFYSIADPTAISGNNYQWNISSSDTSIGANGLRGIISGSLNTFDLKFKVITNCSYFLGSPISFTIKGKSACGSNFNNALTLASQLATTSAANYSTEINLSKAFISSCNGATTFSVSVVNMGPGSFVNQDSITIALPKDVVYANGSFTGIHNAPTLPSPVHKQINGQEYYTWQMPQGVVAGDSCTFSFAFTANPDSLSCGLYKIHASTKSSSQAFCSLTGNNCGINVLTGADSLDIHSFKAYLSLVNMSGYTVPNPPSGEKAFLQFDIQNIGEQIIAANGTTIKYYQDLNSNGIIDGQDTVVVTDIINALIPKNGIYSHTDTILFPAGTACNIIISIEEEDNPCSCLSASMGLNLQLKQLSFDTIICSGQPVQLGTNAITGYSYSWQSTQGLSNPLIANPTLVLQNSTTTPFTTDYYLTVNRINCLSYDTSSVTIYNIPVAALPMDTNYCGAAQINISANTPTGGANGTWTQSFGPSLTNISSINLPLTTISNLQEGSYEFIWSVSNSVCHIIRDSITINFFNPPIAQAGSDSALCGIHTIKMYANNAIGSAFGNWTQSSNNSSIATIINGDSANTTISNLSEGTHHFIWTMNNGTCPAAIDSIRILVYDSVTANAGSDINLCGIYNTSLAANAIIGSANGTWSQTISNPIGATISSASTSNTNISSLTEGSFNFIWTMSNGVCPLAMDTVAVSVFDSVTANAGNDINLCGLYTTTILANVLNGTAIGSWSQLSGPSNATFNPANSNNTTTSALQEGVYNFVWTTVNGICPISKDTMTVNVYDMPISNAGLDQQVCESTTSLLLNGNNPTGTAKGVWKPFPTNASTIFTDSSSYNTTVLNLQSGNYAFTWEVSNGTCPTAMDTMLIKVFEMPDLNFTSTITAICENTCIDFNNISFASHGDSITQFYWSFGDGNFSNNKTPKNCYTTAGIYDVQLIAHTSIGCIDTITKTSFITVNPNPYADFDITTNEITLAQTTIQLSNNSGGYTNLVWDFGDSQKDSSTIDPTHTYNPSIPTIYTISLVVTNTFNCKDSVYKVVDVGPDYTIYFPNTFTPNGDGLNDAFVVKGVGIDTYRMQILNRWGEVLFTSDDINTSWDGLVSGSSEISKTDVFVYKARVKDIFGTVHVYVGHIVVLK
ncbi:MAG: gliding motility-associated C-terminal domain-containing protein [Bacteroidetes bacterium]|nr:gliding motility-associated C-terminal domain-containing protein [Bacteroidota bacterium]